MSLRASQQSAAAVVAVALQAWHMRGMRRNAGNRCALSLNPYAIRSPRSMSTTRCSVNGGKAEPRFVQPHATQR
jgi:hypothetical protein